MANAKKIEEESYIGSDEPDSTRRWTAGTREGESQRDHLMLKDWFGDMFGLYPLCKVQKVGFQ
jgi:hypothetical protein